ncbi:MAG: hypothetical protein WD578_06785, partial [Bacteroidales bacterium]
MITKLRLFSVSLILLVTLGMQDVFGQGVGISETSIEPHVSAILELQSIERGLLVPRMTEVQRDAISPVTNGLIIYNTDMSKLNIYDEGIGDWRIIFSGTGGVNSVTGTLNRISIGGTAADPVIDIDEFYIGQPSITTLGTIIAGTWNATIIGVPYGGTGWNSIPANNLL